MNRSRRRVQRQGKAGLPENVRDPLFLRIRRFNLQQKKIGIVKCQALAAPTAQLGWIEHRFDTPLKVRQDGRSILWRYYLPTVRVWGIAHLRNPQTSTSLW